LSWSTPRNWVIQVKRKVVPEGRPKDSHGHEALATSFFLDSARGWEGEQSPPSQSSPSHQKHAISALLTADLAPKPLVPCGESELQPLVCQTSNITNRLSWELLLHLSIKIWM